MLAEVLAKSPDIARWSKTIMGSDLGKAGVASTAGAATTKAAAVGITSAGTPSTATGRATVTIEYWYNNRDQAAWVPDKTTFPTYKAQP